MTGSEYDVATDELLLDEGLVIPPMITQPFIENAIEHGQLHTIEGGFIRVNFSKVERHAQHRDRGQWDRA